MPLYSYPYHDASHNFQSNRHSRWHAKEDQRTGKELVTERLGDVFRPGVNFHTPIAPSASIFTIGSCFARRLERAAHRAGMKALSLRTQSFLGPDIVTGYVNRYNTASILNELRWAAGESYPDGNFIECSPKRFLDPHSHPVIGGTNLDRIRELRTQLSAYFAQIYKADVVTITLGLIEAWLDKQTGQTLNLNPVYGRDDGQGRKLIHGDRFEFRVMSHAENMENLETIYSLLKQNNPNVSIVVTVSPVPLSATFSHRDAAVANMLSKSMLRSCAETWIARHPDIQYFPSYEMAMMSRPDLVFEADGMHIREDFVAHIMEHFMQHCVSHERAGVSSGMSP